MIPKVFHMRLKLLQTKVLPLIVVVVIDSLQY